MNIYLRYAKLQLFTLHSLDKAVSLWPNYSNMMQRVRFLNEDAPLV